MTGLADLALTGPAPLEPPEETVDGAIMVLPRRAGNTIRDMRAIDALSVALEAAKGAWLRSRLAEVCPWAQLCTALVQSHAAVCSASTGAGHHYYGGDAQLLHREEAQRSGQDGDGRGAHDA